MERVVGPDFGVGQRLAVFVDDAQRPVRIPVPDVDQHLVVVVLRIGVDILHIGVLDRSGDVGRHQRNVGHRKMHVVQVVAAELVLFGPSGRFVETLEIGSRDIPDAVAARSSVGSDVDSGCEVAGPPPRSAYRAGVILPEVMPVHDRSVGRHVEKFVGMPRHEADGISVEDVEKPQGVDRIMVDLESRCGRIEHLRMHGNDDGGRLGHVRQVFRQPVQLLGGEAGDIVEGSAPVVAAAINVVHDDVMDLADVE